MGRNGIDIIIIIYCRLPLKYIAVVDNDDSIVAHPAAHVSDGRGHTRQTAVGWLSGNKIVGVEIAVHVACLKHSQLYIFGKRVAPQSAAMASIEILLIIKISSPAYIATCSRHINR